MTPNASPAPKPPLLRRCWPWAAAAAILSFLTALGIGLYLPSALAPLLENTIRSYAADYGIDDLQFDLHQMTPWQADLHALRLAGEDPEGGSLPRVDHLVIDYSPQGLRAHVVEGVTISGLVFRIVKTETGWRLPGLPDRPLDPAPALAPEPDRSPRPEWTIRRVEIRNSRLVIDHGHRRLTLPLSLTMDHDDQNAGRYRGRLHGSPADQSISVAFELDPGAQALTIAAAEADLDLSRLSDFLGVPLTGRLSAAGKARLQIEPLKLKMAEFQLRLPEGAASFGNPPGLRLSTSDAALATVKHAEDGSWTLQAAELAVGRPDQWRIRNWHGRLHPEDNGWMVEGAFDLEARTPPGDASGTSDAAPGQHLPLTYRGRWRNDASWDLTLSGHGGLWTLNPSPGGDNDPLHFTPRLSMTASGVKNRIQIEAEAQLAEFRTRLAQTRVGIPIVSIRASAEGAGDRFQGRYGIQADNLKIANASARGRLPRVSVDGTFETAGDELRLAGRTRIARGAIRVADHQLSLEGLRIDLPLAWPPDPATAGGRFSLADIKWNDRSLGAVKGWLRQQARGAEFKATHQSALLPGGRLQVDGRLALGAGDAPPRVSLTYLFERAASQEDIDLGAIQAAWAGIQGNGRLTATGRGVYEPGNLQADLRMEIAGGRLTMPQKKAGILGLEGAVVFPDLTALRSAPRQQIAFERTYAGDIAATDGRIDFQIEPGGVFFLEQGRFEWCQGTVYLPATRVVPGKDEYAFTLSCDRLKLAPLLEQIGAARAEGGGTVSGRIPIRVRKGQFLVNSGFLYSSPGEGGTIRLRGTDMLTAGIPPGTPQYNQLELARQALKEYDYDWVKLSLATNPREDLLSLKLQLSGRPTNPLPFIYDTQAGGFVPADPESPGSRFEEIKLDVNFSLPLNRLLEYKDLLNLFS